jgi:hypothetical protein
LSKLGVWLAAPVPVMVLLGAFVLYGGLVVLTYWFIWVLLAGYLVFLIHHGRSEVTTAGTDWVRSNRHWVRTYELTSIRCEPRGGGSSFALVLKDRERRVELPLHVVQANKELWDLVYLGMRYSVANGAETNRSARATFPDFASDAPHHNDH